MVTLISSRFLIGFHVHDGHKLHILVKQVHVRHVTVTLSLFRALSIQITLELPAISVLTKCDLVKEQEKIDEYLNFFST